MRRHLQILSIGCREIFYVNEQNAIYCVFDCHTFAQISTPCGHFTILASDLVAWEQPELKDATATWQYVFAFYIVASAFRLKQILAVPFWPAAKVCQAGICQEKQKLTTPQYCCQLVKPLGSGQSFILCTFKANKANCITIAARKLPKENSNLCPKTTLASALERGKKIFQWLRQRTTSSCWPTSRQSQLANAIVYTY